MTLKSSDSARSTIELDVLVKRYEMGDEDKAWLCSRKLKDYGIDISTWNKEETK